MTLGLQSHLAIPPLPLFCSSSHHPISVLAVSTLSFPCPTPLHGSPQASPLPVCASLLGGTCFLVFDQTSGFPLKHSAEHFWVITKCCLFTCILSSAHLKVTSVYFLKERKVVCLSSTLSFKGPKCNYFSF